MDNQAEILQSITEAIEHLQEVQKGLRGQDYSIGAFQVLMEHAYHDLNFAWNIRNAPRLEIWECSKDNYTKWSKLPVGEINEFEG